MKIKNNTSYYLLLPMLEVDYSHHIECGIEEVYTGCPEYTGDEELGKYLFVTYNNWNKSNNESKTILRSLATDSFTNGTNGLYTLVFEIPEKYKIDVEWFKKGAYSKINKEYVEKYFPKVIVDSNGDQVRFKNRMIFDKDEDLRLAWDIEYGVQIPEGAEVWPKPGERELLKPKQISHDIRSMPTMPIVSE